MLKIKSFLNTSILKKKKKKKKKLIDVLKNNVRYGTVQWLQNEFQCRWSKILK